MKCPECGGEMKPRFQYTWEDKFIGTFSIETQLGEYWYCAECEDEIISCSLMKKIEQEEQRRIEQLLFERAGCNVEKFKENLITNRELVQILGKTRQAIQKDRKIKTLVFQYRERSGQVLYWKESVMLYKVKGDGRFKLLTEENKHVKVAPCSRTVVFHFMDENLTRQLKGEFLQDYKNPYKDSNGFYLLGQNEKTLCRS